MTGSQIAALVVALYLLVAAGVLGALLERERLLNPDGERGGRWVGAVILCSVFWPVVGLLWPESRPLPTPPPRSGWFVHGEAGLGQTKAVVDTDPQGEPDDSEEEVGR